MREQRRVVPMEVPATRWRWGRSTGARFAVAGFLNLTQDHLTSQDVLRSIRGEASLFTPERCDVAVVTTTTY